MFLKWWFQVVTQAFNSSTQEVEAAGSLSTKTVWSTDQVLVQLEQLVTQRNPVLNNIHTHKETSSSAVLIKVHFYH